MTPAGITYIYRIPDAAHRGCVRIGTAPCPEGVSRLLPPDCETLLSLARSHVSTLYQESGTAFRICHARLSSYDTPEGERRITDQDIRKMMSEAGITTHGFRNSKTTGWFDCSADTAAEVLEAFCTGRNQDGISFLSRGKEEQDDTAPTISGRIGKGKNNHYAGGATHGAADALDWDEAMKLIKSLYEDGLYTESMLVSCGCFLGLRISDLLTLTWEDICSEGKVCIREKKTGKSRSLKVNHALLEHAMRCRAHLMPENGKEYIFKGKHTDGSAHITRQRAFQMLAGMKERYGVKSARVFSTHSLRKTFGRRVWQVQCRQGRGEQGLLLLCDVFGHSSISITKRYLGIREEEILSVYDNLNN